MTAPPTVRVHAADAWWANTPSQDPRIPIRADARFVDALRRSGATLAVASRQESVLFLLSATDGACTASAIGVAAPMGLAAGGDAFAVGSALSIRVYRDLTADDASKATYFPVASHVTGAVSVHELGWDGDGGLWFVNTAFSALCRTDAASHFRIAWQPDFLVEHGPLDCCHLNGMAMDASGPRYATALAATGTREGWRARGPDDGVLIDVAQGVVLRDLSMPHSPTLHRDDVWLLESGRGRCLRYSPRDGRTEAVCEIPGIARGLDFVDTLAFVGMSKIRASSGAVADTLRHRFPEHPHCRIYAVDTATGETHGYAELPRISEISSIRALPKPYVRVLQPDNAQTAATYVYTPLSASP